MVILFFKGESFMKQIKKIVFVVFLLILYIYVCNITLIPSSYILMQGEDLDITTLFGLSLQEQSYPNTTLQTVSQTNQNKIETIGKLDFSLSLFNLFKVKQISVNVIPKTTVVPVGRAIGMKLYTDGVLVVGMSEIEGKKPYEHSGIREGDRIVQINENEIENTQDLIQVVNQSQGQEIKVQYIRDEETKMTSMVPAKSSDNQYKLGLWVRDAAAGVGTLTFYEPSSQMFASLGHGILDVDTSSLIQIENGELVTTNILEINKGEKGNPGEIRGTIESGQTIGDISKNTNFGVFGTLTKPSYFGISQDQAMEVALREEIKIGKAQIICELENGKKEYYDIEIQKVFLHNNQDNKSMLIKITDEKLLEKTGGIIQGMSGAPIVQNGKFIGAVTHVLVNDPTAGYGVFADMMLKNMKQVD